MPFAATWMELENLILSEMSQKDKDKYHMIPLFSLWFGKKLFSLKREPSHTVGGNVNWYSHYGEQFGDTVEIYT